MLTGGFAIFTKVLLYCMSTPFFTPPPLHLLPADQARVDAGQKIRVNFGPESVRFIEENRELFQKELRLNPL